MNTSLLSEVNYANQIRTVIKEVNDEYVKDESVNPTLLWEMIKLKIREQSIKYAAEKKAKITRKEEALEKDINVLQKLLDSNELKYRKELEKLSFMC